MYGSTPAGGKTRAGEVLGDRYELSRLLGRGAMAEVYQARDRRADKDVAVKILRLYLARDEEAMQRFQREARVQEMVDHPNVAALYGGGATERGEPYLVMELLRGRTLRHVIRAGAVDRAAAASYCWQALQGLGAVHGVGVLHRDLKPANIMLEPSPGPVDRVVLIDFGFAAVEGGSKVTAAGTVVGSLSYMAPERLRGQSGDERSDVYSMGVILYELLVGHRPFEADDDMDLIRLHLYEKPWPPREAAPDFDIPLLLEKVVLRAMAKVPLDRPQSASEMARELEESMRGVL